MTDSTAIINYFRETLPRGLQQKIILLRNVPETLADWYKWAMKIHHGLQVWNHTITQLTPAGKSPAQKNETGTRRFNFWPRPDPNAMDIDSMTVNKRTELMRKGACFKCKEIGHLSQDCKKTPSRYQLPKKQGYKDAHTLDKEDQAKFYEEAQEQGF